jgi:hypothetical protein
MSSQPRQKDWLDIVVDFFFGAVFCDIWIAVCFARGAARAFDYRGDSFTFGIIMLAGALIAGSLAALYRDQFWSNWETYKVIPPMEESVAKWNKAILWSLFALGWLSLGLLFVR